MYSSLMEEIEMNISELIERLNKFHDEYGDIEVEYAHNDGGIIMCGSSEITEFEIKDDTLIIL